MKNCIGCNMPFEPKHGNNRYHSPECQYEHKKAKQKENNAILSALKKGFLANYKLFTKLHPDSGTKKIPLLNLLSTGFDQFAFYRTTIDKDLNQWYQVNEYFFMVSKTIPPMIQIYKA